MTLYVHRIKLTTSLLQTNHAPVSCVNCFLVLPVDRSFCYRAYLISVSFVLHRRFCYRAYLISVSFVVDRRFCYKAYLISVSFVVDRRKVLQC